MGLEFLHTAKGRHGELLIPVLFEGLDERTCKLPSAGNNVPAMCLRRFTGDCFTKMEKRMIVRSHKFFSIIFALFV